MLMYRLLPSLTLGIHVAKKKTSSGGVNKSEEIRLLLKSGVTSPKEVQAALAARGIQVSPQMVSTIKNKVSARRSARKIGRQRMAVNHSSPPTDIKTLARFIRAVHDLGGVSEARKVLAELEE
jgi:hypothetical protein